MEMLLRVLSFLALNMLLHVHAQTGFISIDCGVDEDYIDNTTKLFYSSDANFIDSGENKNIPYDFTSTIYEKQLTNVRSFPKGVKNCYTLPADQGKDNKYLIRAVFMCGNVQEYNNQLPEFKLYLGVEEWDSVTFNSSYNIVRREIIYVPKTDEIYVCLVNTDSGTPFISALELRPIDDSIYNKTQSGSLVLFNRYNFGSETSETVRYGDDVLDRIWGPYSWSSGESIKASYSSSGLSENQFKLPAKVMETAVKPVNGTSLDFYLDGIDSSQEFYVYLHVAEIETLVQGQIREFTVSVNKETISSAIQPRYMIADTYFTQSSLSGSELNFSLSQTNQSTLPPIMNALEIYMIKEFVQLPTEQRNVDAMKKIKSVYQVTKSSWQGDPCLPRNYSWDGLICSDNGYNAPSITSLNLSSSNLAGKIDKSFSNLTSLQYLDLSYNSLSGEVPEFLSEMSSLKTLNLSGNKLTGSVPSALLTKSNDGTLSLSLDGNPDLCKTNSCNTKTKKKNSVVVPVVASIASVVVLLGAIFAVYWRFIGGGRCGKPAGVKPNDRDNVSQLEFQKPDVPNEEENWDSELEEIQKEVIETSGKLEARKQRLSYSEVKRITNNFEKVIGKGGSGLVYNGRLSNDIKVAVKKLSPSLHQAFEQFQNEAQLLSTIHHRNLVSLIGYCDEGSNMLLIYEYMANGNLKEHISGKNGSVLSWEQRVQIAIEAAQALEYLHDGCNPSIIHRDVKAANILLNEKMQAKVADFGWSRSMPSENQSHVSATFVVGTSGYLDPEYNRTGKLTKESDVYSFGIVLLELISGRSAKIEDNRSILDWFYPVFESGKLEDIVDPRLQGIFSTNSAWRAVETANSCIPLRSIERQTMSYVVNELKECLKLLEMSSPSNTGVTITRPIGTETGPQAR
ncbi:putative leucine-rich repeat receptor-like serine/threonine-protein kinase At2g19230 [Vitis riparia]|uniref:putative leucine-rich repeat receptor-like serine/threonine-protein kinase At2g19230 n=1 Tax=Vitis riparia TaxID=96939 RepID=UPI00155A702C|nr:putative leucine-rich repeat receptor-like serine/threonine-protein kinase At2g19230 [Vitis riparia]